MSVFDLINGDEKEVVLKILFEKAEEFSADLRLSVRQVYKNLQSYFYVNNLTGEFESIEDYFAQKKGLRLYKVVRFFCFEASIMHDNLDASKTIRGIRKFKKEVEKFYGMRMQELLKMNPEERFNLFLNMHKKTYAVHSYLIPAMMTSSAIVVIYFSGLIDSLQKLLMLSLVAVCTYVLGFAFKRIALLKNVKLNPINLKKEPYIFLIHIMLLLTIYTIDSFMCKLVFLSMASVLSAFSEVRNIYDLKDVLCSVFKEVLNIISRITNREELSPVNGLMLVCFMLNFSLILVVFSPLGGVLSGFIFGNVEFGIWLCKISGAISYFLLAIFCVVFSLKYDKYVSIKSQIKTILHR